MKYKISTYVLDRNGGVLQVRHEDLHGHAAGMAYTYVTK